jgi:predicted phosphodiesterase
MKRLIISDIHANLAGLDAVLNHEGSWDEVIFLGDAICAGPQPEEVLQRLATLNGVWIAGNHDTEPFRRTFTGEETSPDRRYMRWTRDQISAKGRALIESFEKTRAIARDGVVLRLHHGHFPKPIGARSGLVDRAVRKLRRHLFGTVWDSRIWPDTDAKVFHSIARAFPEPYVLLAHSHVQFRREVNGTTFINPGSVGQPRLGQPLATYATLEDGEIELKAVPYDVEATCRALDAVPLDETFIAEWKAGYRAGRLPARYKIREWEPLIRQGYR